LGILADPVQLGLAKTLHRQGRLDAAEAAYRSLLKRFPNDTETNYLLGVVLISRGDASQALDRFSRCVRLSPGFAGGWCSQGVALAALGRHAQALRSLDKAVALAPDLVDAHYNRGLALQNLGRHGEAVEVLDRVLAFVPSDTEALNSRAVSWQALGRFEAALGDCDAALAVRPDFAAALCSRGIALNALKRPAEAVAAFEQALTFQPDAAEAWCNRGDALHELGRLESALESYDRALVVRPGLAEAAYGRSLVLLSQGRYAEGLPAYESRLLRSVAPASRFSRQAWLGERPIAGKTLFIHPELYLGDMLNMCRYAVVARQAGARVVMAVQAPLRRLLSCLEVTVIGEAEKVPPFDEHCPLMSLPLAFGSAVAGDVPYLRADPSRVAYWRERMGSHGRRVGVCWQGSAMSVAMDRTFPAGLFRRLTGVRLVNLQAGPGWDDLADVVEEYGAETDTGPRAFEETAALMGALDLVITCDTSIAHLAGALGCPVWVLLRHVPDWRWGMSGDTTPWYPTARLFRQKKPGDWESVFAEVAGALASG
jgi:tetratricopeptide (TPR) repeat protein